MLTVRIKSISSLYLMSDSDWQWIKERLNQALPISILSINRDGSVDYIAIYTDSHNIISLFPEGNKLEYEIAYLERNLTNESTHSNA